MALARPNSLVFVKHSDHRNGAPFILSMDKNQSEGYQVTY